MSSNKLFVGGLAWETQDSQLRQTFEKYGNVTEAVVITDRDTGRSRGFGFVTFSDPQSAQAAKNEMDGANLDGRSLKVDFAAERPRGGGGGGGGGGGFRGGGGGGGGRDGGHRGGGGGRW